MNLGGHRALITGAGQGIGRACADVFSSRGADLVLLDRNPKTLEDVTEFIRKKGGSVLSLPLDLVDSERLRGELEKTQSGGVIDILVNNAGFDRPGTTSKIDTEAFSSVLTIHLTVPLFLIQCLLPSMKSAGWGRIINVSSIYGLIGAKGEIAYSSAKAGLIGLTKSVAKEVGQYGVTVNSVLPGLTRTPTIEQFMAERYKEMIINDTPLGRMAEPEEVAKVIAFLASDDASFITAAAMPVSGGWGI
ncbi:MAG: SDR family NAD(P)-dependent oxidoreductase [Desulfobacteraceae bacterium]|jgi:NAD(P)-dependent dehydrogenase (short-subunit alcohol dehydrogenase family)